MTNKNITTYEVRSNNFNSVVTTFEMDKTDNPIVKIRARIAEIFKINAFEAQQRYHIKSQ